MIRPGIQPPVGVRPPKQMGCGQELVERHRTQPSRDQPGRPLHQDHEGEEAGCHHPERRNEALRPGRHASGSKPAPARTPARQESAPPSSRQQRQDEAATGTIRT